MSFLPCHIIFYNVLLKPASWWLNQFLKCHILQKKFPNDKMKLNFYLTQVWLLTSVRVDKHQLNCATLLLQYSVYWYWGSLHESTDPDQCGFKNLDCVYTAVIQICIWAGCCLCKCKANVVRLLWHLNAKCCVRAFITDAYRYLPLYIS